MKVLIVYASAGAGHRRAAEAIFNYFRDRCPEIDTELVDILEKTNILFKSGYTWGYSFLINYAVFLWQLAYWITDFKFLRPLSRSIASFLNRINSNKFINFLIQEDPDFIISTHFLSSEISASLKKSQKIKSRLLTVVTDFGVHPFWISDGTDTYIVASGFAKKQLVMEGIKESSIMEFGIPIDSKFFQQYDKDELYKKFEIDRHKFCVLIMTGSFGVGPIEKIIKLLHKDIQILVVCAANKKLYGKLKKENLSNVKVFGFIDNPQELMAISDIIITKGGGLSIQEALAMELIPIFISPIPGQEENNIKILQKYEIGFSPKNIKDIKNIILDFKDHPHKLKYAKDNIKKIKKPNALKEICNVVCQGSSGTSR